MLLLALPLLLAAGPAPQEPSAHPATVEELAEALDIDSLHFEQAENLELWFEDTRKFRETKDHALKAWELATEWLGGLYMGVDNAQTMRVVVLNDQEALAKYVDIVQEEARRIGAPPPPDEMASSAAETGSYLWTYPPVLLVSGRLLHKGLLTSRVVHDMAAIRARYALCPWAGDPPEFWQEGFAGLLMRHTMKRPTPIVSHEQAALKFRMYGYGVFAGVSNSNDASDDPTNWPLLLKNAVRAMRKEKDELDRDSMVDQLLMRTNAEFARTDYAYSWAVIEFLLDDYIPIGEEGKEWARDSRGRRPRDPLEDSRQAATLAVLEELRRARYASYTAEMRTKKFRELLLEQYAEDPEAIHSAFMAWVEKDMPKR